MLSARGLTKHLGGRAVLDHVDLDIRPGEVLAVMGPSGTGKSVLLKHLVGLIRPDSGRVVIDGVDFWAQPERERRILRGRFGVAFQEGALFDALNVYENVAFPLKRHAREMGGRNVRKRVGECLELVRLAGIEKKLPAQLSTGMRRRVGFARAIALRPEILLFDEPTSGLDPMTARILDQVIVDLANELEAATVVVTHDVATAQGVAARVALLLQGKILVDAPVEDFFQLQNPIVRQIVEGRAEGPLTSPEFFSPAPEGR